MLEFSWVAGDFVDTVDTTLRSETLLIPLALLSSRLSFCEIWNSRWKSGKMSQPLQFVDQKKVLTLLLSDGLINVTSSRVSKILLGPLTIRIWLMRRLASSTMTNRRLDSLSTDREHLRWCSRGHCTWHSKSELKRRPWWWVLRRRWWWSRTDPPLV